MVRLLHTTTAPNDPDLLLGIEAADDAGVYRLKEDVALVQSVDFFTPIVDEPGDWGRIAAANALSDVYAMGGSPLTALQLVSWPRDTLPLDLLGEVMDGGSEVMAAANCIVIGGHSIDDQEPKYGFAVTGLIHPDDLMTKASATATDVLVLTKPIGTGIISTAIKHQTATTAARDSAVTVMSRLNEGAARAARRVRVQAATDVTGFGLLGHLAEVVRASGVSAELDAEAVPLLPDVVALAEEGMIPGGTKRNLRSVESIVDFNGIDKAVRVVLADAQTSGGLLLSVAEPLQAALVQALADEGEQAWVIGRMVERAFADGPSGRIRVR